MALLESRSFNLHSTLNSALKLGYRVLTGGRTFIGSRQSNKYIGAYGKKIEPGEEPTSIHRMKKPHRVRYSKN